MAKFDFQNLNVADGRTGKLVLHQIALGGSTPFLTVKPATDATKGYYNAVLRRAGKSVRQVQAGAINASLMNENRDDDRRLYPLHIIVGWGYIKDDGEEVVGFMPDADGAKTPFTKENCHDFVAALPNWLFDDVRQYCGNSVNFVSDEHVETAVEVEVAAKN